MFNSKPYMSVNREERFFCALLLHALLASASLRDKFSKFVDSQWGIFLNPDDLQVFVEPAVLRDYWHDLGCPQKYSKETHERRLAILNILFRKFDVDGSLLEKLDVFWTSGSGSKLCYPGHWNKKKLNELGLERLAKVCWAFNAKPDMLFISPDNGVLVMEAKIESAEGRNGYGYNQIETQKLIIDLWTLLIPAFKELPAKLATIKIKQKTGEQGMSWNQLTELMNGTDIDLFTRDCFGELLSRFEAKGS